MSDVIIKAYPWFYPVCWTYILPDVSIEIHVRNERDELIKLRRWCIGDTFGQKISNFYGRQIITGRIIRISLITIEYSIDNPDAIAGVSYHQLPVSEFVWLNR